MAKYVITRQVIYSQQVEVEAESTEDALNDARVTSDDKWSDQVFVDYDYYEVEG